MKILFSLLLCSGLYGCASSVNVPDNVDSDKTDTYAYLRTETATVEKDPNKDEELLLLITLDDEYLYDMGKDYEFPEQSYVAEGRHKITVKYAFDNRYAIGCIWFDAQIGERYVVKTELEEFKILFRLENEKTGLEIGAVCKAGPNS